MWRAPWESEDAEAQSPPPMTCPWCGGEMQVGYLVGGQDLVRVMWERPGTFRLTDPDGTLYLRGDGGFWSDYKLAWHCETCRKLVVDTTGCDRAGHPPPRRSTAASSMGQMRIQRERTTRELSLIHI